MSGGWRLRKESLVRKGKDFDQVYKCGRRLHGTGFSLICLRNSTGASRLGISVHRKIRGAAKRNRLKRIIRESFRLNRLSYPQGVDMVFTVRSDFRYENPSEITAAVRLVQKKLKTQSET